MLSTVDMLKNCLLFYLEPLKDLLQSDGEYPENFSINELAEQVKDIYEQHKSPLLWEHYDMTMVGIVIWALSSI